MAKQTINTGSADYAGDGESIRSALIKVNENFTEVYADVAAISTFSGNYNDLTNKPTLFDGDYNSLTNQPTLPEGIVEGSNYRINIAGSDSTIIVDTDTNTVTADSMALSAGGTISTTGAGADKNLTIQPPSGDRVVVGPGTWDGSGYWGVNFAWGPGARIELNSDETALSGTNDNVIEANNGDLKIRTGTGGIDITISTSGPGNITVTAGTGNLYLAGNTISFTGTTNGISYNDLNNTPIIRTVEITDASTITASRKTVTPDTHLGIELTTTPTGAPLLTLPDGSYNGQTYFVTENYQGGSNVDISVTNYWNKVTEAIETVTVNGPGALTGGALSFVWTGSYWTRIG